MSNANPYDEYANKFCKVIIKTDSGDKSLKGTISIFEQLVTIKGDYQTTTIPFSEIIRITTREQEDVK